MDIALGAIVILFILFPGIAYRRGYFSEEFSNQYTHSDFFKLFVSTLFPSVVLYLGALILIQIFNCISGNSYSYDLGVIVSLLSSNEIESTKAIESIRTYQNEIIFFQIVLCVFSFLLGICFKNIVIKKNLDTKIKFLRYKNVWHYINTAKFFLFPRSQISVSDNIKDIDNTMIDAWVVKDGIENLYNGILVDYELGENGGLDLLYIKNAKKKSIDSDEFEDINGNILILKYENIVNINYSYFLLEYDEEKGWFYRLIK